MSAELFELLVIENSKALKGHSLDSFLSFLLHLRPISVQISNVIFMKKETMIVSDWFVVFSRLLEHY